nr:uncharacterized protein LOC120965303 [Aegilops tauschii subsp. strangulata]
MAKKITVDVSGDTALAGIPNWHLNKKKHIYKEAVSIKEEESLKTQVAAMHKIHLMGQLVVIYKIQLDILMCNYKVIPAVNMKISSTCQRIIFLPFKITLGKQEKCLDIMMTLMKKFVCLVGMVLNFSRI